ncbi:MAG: prolyl oligopeptidase family serine peptidase [Trueperaceae bacterium]|nr:prolyl oligopeptidase family serine peptidase [Trueperaceae bacterium]
MKHFVIALIFLFSLGSAQEVLSLSDQGLERHYILRVPETISPEQPLPLVILLHGRGGNGASMERITKFTDLLTTHSFIAVYPDGIDGQWNYVRGIPGYPESVDDSQFLLHLIDHIAESYPVDRKRLYVTGFSNGGFMTQRLACEVPDVFAAFASVGAAGFGGMPSICEHDTAVSFLFMHGTFDAVVPWDGYSRTNSAGVDVLILADVPRTFAYWAKHSGCSNDTEKASFPQTNEASSVTTLKVLDCPARTETILYIVSGGGHNWPGHPGIIQDEVAGTVNTDINASEEIWQFFSRHQLD